MKINKLFRANHPSVETTIRSKKVVQHVLKGYKREYQKFQNRIDSMYLDKLDGEIDQEYYQQKSEEWRNEQAEILRKIERHQNANRSYLDEGINIIELAQKAVILYNEQNMSEKRRLVDIVLSNSTWKNGRLISQYRQTLEMLTVTQSNHQTKKVANPQNDDLRLIRLLIVDAF